MIAFKNVSFSYENESETDSSSGINDINLEVEKGELLLLTGQSGCGKSTLLRVINGLCPNFYDGVLKGTVSIGGVEIQNKEIYDISKLVSTVFQNPKSQFFNLDSTSEILFALENQGKDRELMKLRLNETANLFGIAHLLDKNIFELSGGEKQIIAIASAYASDTPVILMDEPTSNLDNPSIKKVARMLDTLKSAGKTIIICEHRLYFLKGIADRVVTMNSGCLSEEYTGKTFFSLCDSKRISCGLRSLSESHCHVKPSAPTIKNKKNIVKIERLAYRYKKAKDDILNIKNIELQFGEIIGITGDNGQGKSTFAGALTGLLKTKGSRIYIGDKLFSDTQRLKISYVVLQDVGYQLFTQSVAEELRLGAKSGLSDIFIEEIARKLNIAELSELHPLSLSGGQKQRVSIGAGLCADARILIFDEPTSGMDYCHMVETAKLIKETANKERLILIITHDMEFLNLVADTVFVMRDKTLMPY